MDPTPPTPHVRLKKSVFSTLVGLLINGLLAVIKLIAGVFGSSHALVADGIESLADSISSIIVLRAVTIASKPADEEHPYGHGKAEPIAAAMVSGMLLFAAGWIIKDSVFELLQPAQNPAPYTLLVLALVILIKECLFRFSLKIADDVQSLAIQTDAWHHRSDAITSIAAGIGITISLLGGPPFSWADKVAAIFGAFIICWNAIRLLRPALDELMDKAPDPELLLKVRNIASETHRVAQIEKCFIRKIGFYHHVDIHVQVDPQMPMEEAHHVAHDVKDRLKDQIPSIHEVLVHLEPLEKNPRAPKNSNCSHSRST